MKLSSVQRSENERLVRKSVRTSHKFEVFTDLRNMSGDIVMAVYSSVSLLYRISMTYFLTTKCNSTGVTNVKKPTTEQIAMPRPAPLASIPFCHNTGCDAAPATLVVSENSFTRSIWPVYLPLYMDSPNVSFFSLLKRFHFFLPCALCTSRTLWTSKHCGVFWLRVNDDLELLLLNAWFGDNVESVNRWVFATLRRFNRIDVPRELRRNDIFRLTSYSTDLSGHNNIWSLVLVGWNS